jgi:hypothetical protein
MCDSCSKVLINFGIPHSKEDCPLRASYYCSNCAISGHLQEECTNTSKYAKPTFVEQFIPPSVLKEYNITTLTPLPYKESENIEPSIEIKDDDRVIRHHLLANSIQPSGRPKDNRIKLFDLVKKQGKRLVLVK